MNVVRAEQSFPLLPSESTGPNSGLEIFGDRPLNPEKLQMRIAAEYQRSLDNAPEFVLLQDDKLLDDQVRSLSLEIPVTVLILGACGSLASGFLSRGAFELGNFLGEASSVRYIMCDIFAPDSPEVARLIEKRREENEYTLHETVPYLSVSQLNAETVQRLGIDLMVAATPPNVHIADAIRAEELGVQTYIEKPAYPAGYGAEKRPIIEQALDSGKVGLIDFFLGNRALIDFLNNPEKYLSGDLITPGYSLGEIEYIHATCLEPHSVNEEGARQKMLMSFEAQGGFLYADQAPHPLAIMEATLNGLFGRSLSESRVAATYRTRESVVPGPTDAETGAAVLRVLDTGNSARVPTRAQIELLSVVGKGVPVIGGADQIALPNYMLTIGCTAGRLDICVGNGQNTLPSYLSITPSDPALPTRLFEYSHSGLGYSLILADFVIAAQAERQGVAIPAETAARLARHTTASMAAMRSIEEVYQLWNRNPDPLQHYGSGEPLPEPTLPSEMPLGCFIHGHIREDESRRVGRDLLKQK